MKSAEPEIVEPLEVDSERDARLLDPFFYCVILCLNPWSVNKHLDNSTVGLMDVLEVCMYMLKF